MRVFVLGGYGLIGSSIVADLLQAGHSVVGLTRSPRAARIFPNVEWREGDLARLTSAGDWRPLLSGVDAVVNCAGALQDSPRDSLNGVHVAGPIALFQACADVGIRRFVHISAAGIDNADTAFARTKRQTEEILQRTTLNWVILRPGFVVAPHAFGGSALVRGLAGLPFWLPLPASTSLLQTVAAEDVAETVRLSLDDNAPSRVVWELVHPGLVTLKDVILAFRAWLGFAPARVIRFPMLLAGLVSRIADIAGLLGWRSPLRTTALKQLRGGVKGNPAAWMTATGIRPKSLAEALAEHPAGVQERWFARAYFIKPLGVVLLAGFWIGSGLIGVGLGYDRAVEWLHTTALPRAMAEPCVIAGSLLDIALGALVLVHDWARIALVGMAVLCGFYIIAGTVLRPELWLDPLGPLMKILPTAFAALAVLALMDER